MPGSQEFLCCAIAEGHRHAGSQRGAGHGRRRCKLGATMPLKVTRLTFADLASACIDHSALAAPRLLANGNMGMPLAIFSQRRRERNADEVIRVQAKD